MKTTIYLPKFPGFYDSILSSIVDREEEYIIENLIEDGKISPDCDDKYSAMTDIIEIDYKKTREDIAKQYYDIFKSKLQEGLENIGITLGEYESLHSPTYYNYGTDEVNISIDYDIEKIIQYLNDNREEFTKYIKENNTSYDGFIAFLENTFDDYIKDLRDDCKEAQLTQVIDFYIENMEGLYENNITLDIYYDIEPSLIYEYITK